MEINLVLESKVSGHTSHPALAWQGGIIVSYVDLAIATSSNIITSFTL